MADYTPVALPGTAYTFTATGALVGGDLVGMSGALTVTKVSSAASLAYVGIAGHDTAIGSKVTVYLAKMINESVAEGTVTAGDQLVSSAVAGRQVKSLPTTGVDVTATPSEATIETAVNAAVNNARAVLGTAVNTAADNTLVRWVQR